MIYYKLSIGLHFGFLVLEYIEIYVFKKERLLSFYKEKDIQI
jgi:hypothetical protein